MPTIILASSEAKAGRTTVAAGLGALLAGRGQSVRLARLAAPEGGGDATADDARVFSTVPGCTASANPATEQDALVFGRDAGTSGLVILEAPPGIDSTLAARLSARIVLVTNDGDDVARAKTALGDALAGVVATRVPERRRQTLAAEIEAQNVPCLAVLLEDRQLAGPNVREMAGALHASRLVELGDEDEAVEYVMLGPISADPGQPYFLQHGSKAVVNRFDKMDLHLAALATEPDCLILTGGQQPSPYLTDRVAGGDFPITVLLAPDSTVRTVELLDDLFGNTRFEGNRKLTRAIELLRSHADMEKLNAALGETE